jgi:hypothetical protein
MPPPSPSMRRELEGSGFHLTVSTSVNLPLDASCSHWAMMERLPQAAFFDPFQLARLSERGALGGAKGATVLSKAAVESFAANSEPAAAIVYGRLDHSDTANAHQTKKVRQTAASAVPLHLRYDAPSQNQTHRFVELPPPEFFVCCGRGTRRAATPTLCPLIDAPWRGACVGSDLPRVLSGCGSWRRRPVSANAETLHAHVPVGHLADRDLVLVLTGASICIGTLAVLRVLCLKPIRF